VAGRSRNMEGSYGQCEYHGEQSTSQVRTLRKLQQLLRMVTYQKDCCGCEGEILN